jgi:hypothetical protein
MNESPPLIVPPSMSVSMTLDVIEAALRQRGSSPYIVLRRALSEAYLAGHRDGYVAGLQDARDGMTRERGATAEEPAK